MSQASEPQKRYMALYEKETGRLETLRGEEVLDQIERIVALAETHGDVVGALDWRREFIRAASALACFDRELAAFADLMRIYREGPPANDIKQYLLWYYKWILERLADHSEIPMAQIETMFEQMQTFYEEAGESLAPVWSLRYRTAAFMGDAAAAEGWLEKWQEAETGESDDCPACQLHTRVQALLDLGRMEDALGEAMPLLRGEQPGCDEVPATTFSRLMIPALLAGQPQAAMSMHRAVRRQVRYTPKLLSHLGDHVMFAATVGGHQTALRLGCIMLRQLASCRNSFDRYYVYRAGWYWLMRRQDAGLPVVLPARVLGSLPREAARAADLAAWFHEQADRLAATFDARHGTDRFERFQGLGHQLLEFFRALDASIAEDLAGESGGDHEDDRA